MATCAENGRGEGSPTAAGRGGSGGEPGGRKSRNWQRGCCRGDGRRNQLRQLGRECARWSRTGGSAAATGGGEVQQLDLRLVERPMAWALALLPKWAEGGGGGTEIGGVAAATCGAFDNRRTTSGPLCFSGRRLNWGPNIGGAIGSGGAGFFVRGGTTTGGGLTASPGTRTPPARDSGSLARSALGESASARGHLIRSGRLVQAKEPAPCRGSFSLLAGPDRSISPRVHADDYALVNMLCSTKPIAIARARKRPPSARAGRASGKSLPAAGRQANAENARRECQHNR
jgi:hypothetical protein